MSSSPIPIHSPFTKDSRTILPTLGNPLNPAYIKMTSQLDCRDESGKKLTQDPWKS